MVLLQGEMMKTYYEPIEVVDVVEFYCESCGCTQPHEIQECGDFEYYRCKVCGYQVSYRVR